MFDFLNEVTRYHRADVRQYLGAYVPRPYVDSDEFQEWFKAGLRRCDNHPYPYKWHIIKYGQCPKCFPPAPDPDEKAREKRQAKNKKT